MQVQSYENKNRITEFTKSINVIPNKWGMVTQMGLFEEEGVSQTSITFDKVTVGSVLLVDKPRGERTVFGSQEDRETHSRVIPHFPYDDSVKPEQLQGVRVDGDPNGLTNLDIERMKVLDRARRNWAATMEIARVEAIKGNIYAPNGTISGDWYTEFGVTQKVEYFDFADTAVTNDMISHVENIIDHIQDNLLTGDVLNGDIVALVGKTFFANLIKHPSVREAYLNFAATNQGGAQPLRDRLGHPTDARARQFSIGGITFVEYNAKYKDAAGNTVRAVEENEGFAFPMGVDGMFKTFYAPANRFSTVNTVGVSQYVFEKYIDDVEWQYQTESNFLNMNTRPQAVVKLSGAVAP